MKPAAIASQASRTAQVMISILKSDHCDTTKNQTLSDGCAELAKLSNLASRNNCNNGQLEHHLGSVCDAVLDAADRPRWDYDFIANALYVEN